MSYSVITESVAELSSFADHSEVQAVDVVVPENDVLSSCTTFPDSTRAFMMRQYATEQHESSWREKQYDSLKIIRPLPLKSIPIGTEPLREPEQPLSEYRFHELQINGLENKGKHAGGGSNTKKIKRSWSRAVFSNLQKKGLEKTFLKQKYITNPDRKRLAANLGLHDSQVKVWFQNRRMKWRKSLKLNEAPTIKITSSEDELTNYFSQEFLDSSSSDEDLIID